MLTSSSKTSYTYARRILALPVLSLSILLFAFKLSNNQQATSFTHTNAPFTLVVDAGHGGDDDGAVGQSDEKEKTFNLAIAKKIAELAPQYGITVKMTRTEDVTVSLPDRMAMIKKEQPDAFVSIHVDATEEKQTSKEAFSVCITKNNAGANYNQSRLLGSSLIQSVKTNLPVNDNLMQRTQGIYVLDQNPYPAVIIECGYMNNEKSLQQITSDAGMTSIAKDILEGVVAYANRKEETSSLISDTSGKQPLYIVDGKEISKEELQKIDSNKIESMHVWKGKEAIAKYGKKGENGVVEVKTKTQESIQAQDKKEFTGIVLLDGKEITKADMEKLTTGGIKQINVLKGDEAVKTYGEKGKNGVIIITSKVPASIMFSPDSGQTKDHYDVVFNQTEEAPSFPGGNEAWIKYLQQNLHASIPTEHGAPAGKYVAIVQFQVDSKGNISNLKAVQDPGYGVGAEAVRVIQRGPKWIPAKQNGETVTTITKQPITFQISEVH